jgi:hypothetical protein
MKKIYVAAAVGILMSSVIQNAYAESNGLSAVERPATAATIFSAPPRIDVGSESYPSFPSGNAVPIVAGGVLQPNGSEGIVQTANSLPLGFTIGTPAYEYAQSVQRYFVARAAREMLARAVASGRHPG